MPYVLSSMDLEEVLAEKVRTMATRSKARDLFDVALLTGQDVTVGRDLVDRKMGLGDQTFDRASILDRTEHVGRFWDRELRILMEHVPPFEEALSAMEGLLEVLDAEDSQS